MAFINPFKLWTRPDRPVSRRTFFVITLSVIAFDQLTKWLAILKLEPLLDAPTFDQQKIDVIPNYFALIFARNTGAAFSILTGYTGILAIVSTLISAGLIYLACRFKPAEQGMRVAFGLIVGGAIGNLIDRVFRGYVVDFLHAHWQWTYQWPTFNIADSAVCIGIGLMVVASFRLPQDAKASVAAEKTSDSATPGPAR